MSPIFSQTPDQLSGSTIDQLVTLLAQSLESRGASVTAAESCTGGGVAAALTSRAGSSAWFEYGFVTYSNAAKQAMLGVTADIFEQHGAVSQACVEAMVDGALRVSGADYGVAISGVAGPSGGSQQKPVGTVWFSWACQGVRPESACFYFNGDRQQVRHQAVIQALKGLLAAVKK